MHFPFSLILYSLLGPLFVWRVPDNDIEKSINVPKMIC